MFNKRVNLLFDQDEWERLTVLASLKNANASQLIRVAIRKTYFSDQANKTRKSAFYSIIKERKTFKNINYKALINYGRKF